uniref:Uncharacterized protein n=1 Tax=Leersia perrieri TaxID=77586 RepID=A0A0D9XPT8_9ORYZ
MDPPPPLANVNVATNIGGAVFRRFKVDWLSIRLNQLYAINQLDIGAACSRQVLLRGSEGWLETGKTP